MKQSREYTKQFRFIGFALVILVLFPFLFSSAQTASELNNKIEQKTSEIKKLEQEISSYQVELTALGKERDSLATALKELDITRKKLNADISVTEKKIDQTNFKIEGLSKDIGVKQNSISGATDAVALALRQTNEFETHSLVEVILSEEDFSYSESLKYYDEEVESAKM